MTELLLRDGVTTTQDPRLDLIWDKDPRNRLFPLMQAGMEPQPLVSKTWEIGPVTDQGAEGACVGHGWTGWFTGEPLRFRATPTADEYALGYYKECQRIDEWPGEGYSGTSVKAGGELARTRGLLSEYRWAFGLQDVLQALSHVGPVVLGVPWYDSMYDAPGGRVTISGTKVGGHCILAVGINADSRTVTWKNSWGLGYGVQGLAQITFDDLDRLLREGGEACVPTPVLPETGALSQ